MATQARSSKKKKKINPNGVVHIKATFNNTNICLLYTSDAADDP